MTNHFYRRGTIAAHVFARSGRSPRFIVAFPAGNAGAGLWFDAQGGTGRVAFGGVDGLEGRAMRGVAGVASVATRQLVLRLAVLGSLRAVREANRRHCLPAGHAQQISPDAGAVTLRRTTAAGRRLEVALAPIDGGRALVDDQGRVILSAAEGAPTLRFRLIALQDDPPLTPIPANEILLPGTTASGRDLEALAFLAYREKLLAGSWRFLTYFGRDTLVSLRLLLPVLRAEVVEAGLGAVLERLGPSGEVAHEEDVGEWAAIANGSASRSPLDRESRRLDYGMVDDDFLLGPVFAAWALDTRAGRSIPPRAVRPGRRP